MGETKRDWRGLLGTNAVTLVLCTALSWTPLAPTWDVRIGLQNVVTYLKQAQAVSQKQRPAQKVAPKK